MINVQSEVVLSNIGVKELIKHAVQNGEGELSSSGVFSTVTGKRTGRSPQDRFIVQDNLTNTTVDWGDINRPISQGVFSTLWNRALESIRSAKHYVSDLQVGQESQYALPVKVITELAWHNAFCCHMFVEQDMAVVGKKQEWTILNSVSTLLNGKEDGVNSDGAVIINLSERKVLLCGMRYAGEMKKAMFTVLNYFLPDEQVLPMHCAANMGDQGDVAIFFGLSGTGKTTLSADPQRCLIGDDEHGWSDKGVFNFEGGCYAKCIDLTIEREPVIWNAIRQDCIMENVVLKKGGHPDFTDDSLTQNSRAAYPRDNIKKKVIENKGGNPKTVLFLTCDLYGVLPPVSLINKYQAAYYFLSGYTALVGSTEIGGLPGVHPTFSTCFGAPFFPRPVGVYAELLLKHVEANQSQVYLINTGWKGGSYGEGERFAIPDTRRVVAAAVSGELIGTDCEIYPGFGFEIPKHIEGFSQALLDPRNIWENQGQLKEKTNFLISLFQENFKRFKNIDPSFEKAGPTLI